MTYKVAIAGLSHDHVWAEVPHWLAHPAVDIVGLAEESASLVARADEEWGVETSFASVESMLTETYPDICLCFGSNRESAEHAQLALSRQIHVMIEKPLSANERQAKALVTAVRASQAELMVNWPEWWLPSYQIAGALMQRGAIGDVTGVRVRMGHRGPKAIGCSPEFCRWLYDVEENGGGASADYACYGLAAALYLLGRPTEVSADYWYDDHESVDLEAALTLTYEAGLSQVSASWRQEPPMRDHTFFGTGGTIWLDREDLWVQTGESERIHLKPTPQDVPLANAAQYFIDVIENKKPVEGIWGVDLNADVMACLAAAAESARSGARTTPNYL